MAGELLKGCTPWELIMEKDFKLIIFAPPPPPSSTTPNQTPFIQLVSHLTALHFEFINEIM